MANPLTLEKLFRADPTLPRVALSIRQPWCHFILTGQKDIENRSWKTGYRGEFLIHASKQSAPIYDEDDEFWIRATGKPFPRDLTTDDAPQGGIVGVVEIVDVVTESKSPWFVGPVGFVLRNARPLPFVPLKGALGFFKV